MPDFPYVYPYSFSEAKKKNEINQWVESHAENIMCKKAIESAIRSKFDGFFLSPDCAKSVLAEYGYKRVSFVLANTIQEKSHDGRFDPQNKEWAHRQYIPKDGDFSQQFIVESHPAVLNGFVNQFQNEYADLKLFGPEHCDTSPDAGDYTGKVLIMSPSTLKESYWSQENQLWLASGGFGCSPNASGRAVYATCLGDGEITRWDRADFLGPIKEEHLPDWAKQQVEKLNNGQEIGPVSTDPAQVMQYE